MSIAVSGSPFATGAQASLTAALDEPLVGEKLVIWDTTANASIGNCTTGSTCTKTTSFHTGNAYQYQAFVTATSGTGGPGTGRIVSTLVSAERLDWAVNLTTDKTQFTTSENFTLTATTNQDLNYSAGGFRLYIVYMAGSGTSVKESTTGATCATTNFKLGAPRDYEAIVQRSNVLTTTPEAASNTVTLTRTPLHGSRSSSVSPSSWRTFGSHAQRRSLAPVPN